MWRIIGVKLSNLVAWFPFDSVQQEIYLLIVFYTMALYVVFGQWGVATKTAPICTHREAVQANTYIEYYVYYVMFWWLVVDLL